MLHQLRMRQPLTVTHHHLLTQSMFCDAHDFRPVLIYPYLYNVYIFRAPAAPVGPSENPTFTLFYFNIKALAEPVRYLFAYGGQEYEDVRVTRDEWPALKPSRLPNIYVCI